MRVRFRGVTHREAVLFEGPSGWGEFCPFPEYEDGEAAAWLAAALEAAWGTWPDPVRETVPVNATVPVLPPAQVPEFLARFGGAGTAKVKVADPGQSPADDVARVRAVREALGPDGEIRVDANGAWSVAEAVDALTALAPLGLQYAEQPCATVAEMVDLRGELDRRGVPVPLAADESIRRAADPLRVARSGAADVAVLKVSPLGGVAATVDMAARLSTEFGMRTVISSALETSVGMVTGVAAAAALADAPLACGLGTVTLFTDEPGNLRAAPRHGSLRPGRVRPDRDRLERLVVSGDRRTWWLDRLARCHRILEER